MKAATYTAIDFCQVGACALLTGVHLPDGVEPYFVTQPVQSFDHATGVIETKSTRYAKAAIAKADDALLYAPSKLYKPTHGGYPG